MKTKVMMLVIGFFVIYSSSQAVILTYLEVNGSEDSPRGLYDFDTVTGISTLQSPMSGGERLFKFASHPSNGNIYAISGNFSSSRFYDLDPSTGNTSLIWTGGWEYYQSIAFDPISEELYAIVVSTAPPGLGFNYYLATVDPATGRYSTIGQTHDAVNLVFSDTGELFGMVFGNVSSENPLMGNLIRINKTSGSYTSIGGITPFTTSSADSIFAGGYIYSTDWGGNIFKTDPETGEGVLIGNTGMGDGLGGLFIPEPSSLALIGLGGLVLRRRRRNLT